MADSFPRQNARTQRFTLGAPRNFTVIANGARVLFARSRGPEDPVNLLWVHEVETGDERVLVDPGELLSADADLPAAERARRERARESAAGIVGYAVDASGDRVTFVLAGVLYVVDVVDGAPRQLEAAPGAFDPRLSPDGRMVSYVVGDELHVISTDAGGSADRAGAEGEATVVAAEQGDNISWGSAEFIAAEEMRRARGHWWSPDSDRLAVARVDVSPVEQWHIADPAQPWVAPTPIRYPAAGTDNADVSLHVVGLDGAAREVRWDRDLLPYLVDVRWVADEPFTIVTSSRDQRRMCVFTVEPDAGDTELVATLTDPDWVEIVPGTPRWCDERLLTIVEHDGWRRVVIDGVPATPDGHWVRDVVSAADGEMLYTASVDPTEVRLFKVDLGAKETAPVELHPGAGSNGVTAAVGSGSVRVESHARLDAPTSHHVESSYGRRSIASYAAQPAKDPAVEIFAAGPDEVRTAVLFPTWSTDGPLPLLLDPYGGPHAQRVLRSRNAFLASQWFADQGFCVVVADGRGTPGRGGGWERAVRGDLAQPVLDDQIAALDAVLERFGDRVDRSRVGIRGWSFGGYLAALAVLRRPDRFHAAVAGAPVTDWRWYDTHYTERYLGDPRVEPENYDRTSLLTEAASLHRPLMLIHGLADDNVVAAHTLQLSSALLAAGRPHEVLPLSGVTHMTPQEEVAENLLLLQVEFLQRHLGAG